MKTEKLFFRSDFKKEDTKEERKRKTEELTQSIMKELIQKSNGFFGEAKGDGIDEDTKR